MSEKITFSLSPSSIAVAVKDLRNFAKHIERCAWRADDILSREAADEAREHFSEDVTVQATEHGVVAKGQSVVFEEFGAGARISDPYPDGADVDFEIRKGAYSDLHEGEYAQSGYEMWHHDGQEYRYVTPGNGLFYGMMRARDRAAEVFREVLNEPW